MPTLDLKLNVKQLATLALAAHAEDQTLNAYINARLQDAAEQDIERFEKNVNDDAESNGDQRR